VSDEFAKLSVPEIHSLIERAHAEISRRKEAGKEKLKAEIADKLRNAGLDFEDLFPDSAKKGRGKIKSEGEKREVAPKFKNPVSGETWSGRGARPPRWVAMIMSERRWTLEEFKQSDEFLA
jgi:DNA-binding protein H-NS